MPGTLAISSTCVDRRQLAIRAICMRLFSTYILQRLLGLDLHDRQERIIGRLQIFELRNTARRAHGERASKASPSCGREFRGFDQFPGVVGGVQQRNDDAVGAGVEGPCITIISLKNNISNIRMLPLVEDARLTIQASLAAIRTMGLTPHAAMAATASCICQSADICISDQQVAHSSLPLACFSPAMFPCSVSTQIQS